ncbi:TniB family NTP-binding protein [Sphingomonas sp. IC081]|uniref:TniB family NTP-binding protein n=1 Tax=Sphingomonas sp. IC081 TaxID=304378 RepID=UPI001156D4EA|nr:TniB family NTP-binding protein [Sphingomonas sp. IC081]QDK35911.1 transposase [Sphingomonas sp. IC081]QDK35968.1 transposase [Sphingomonas sp. IC081]
MEGIDPAQPKLPFWIDFKEARQAVNTLVGVAHDEPDERPPVIILVGQSGMGKTSILREAKRRIDLNFPQPPGWNDARYTPMLRTVIPASPTSLKINLTLLWKQGWPITTSIHRIADLKVVELLGRQRTRLVAVDNVHAILTAGGKARRDTLDAFRFLMSEGNVPMVVAGLDVAADIFAEDVELAYRSIILKLKLWPPGEPSQQLIQALARGMHMIEPDRFFEPDTAEFIWRHSRGVTGNFKRLLHWGGKIAKEDGRQRVEFDDLRAAAAMLPALA